MRRTVAVIGGGLAGIATCVRLAEAGLAPTLLESRRKLGGRATSFDDQRTGEVLDNCQHVVLGCCTNLLDLYQRLGVLDRVAWGKCTYWANPPGDPDALGPTRGLPAPLHAAPSFLRARWLGGHAKRRIARALWRIARLRDVRSLHGRTFAAFLRDCGQREEELSGFWEPIVVGACNLPCERVEAACALSVFRLGFLPHPWSGAVGIPRVPLRDLYDPAQAIIEAAGGSVRLGVSAVAIGYDGARATGVVTDEGLVEAGSVVSTVPPERLGALCGEALGRADPRVAMASRFESSPILGIHLFFDQPVMQTPHLVLPRRATHWLFDKGRDSSGRFHVHAVVSAAEEWMALDEPAIVARVLEDVAWAIPSARGLAPLAWRTVKEKRATFAATPGVERPGAAADGIRGGVRNLFLAGDWCDTGWPATMEGAVRSGYAAAAAIAGSGGVLPDVPAGALARFIGLGGGR